MDWILAELVECLNKLDERHCYQVLKYARLIVETQEKNKAAEG